MSVLACNSCQFVTLTWSFPHFPELLMALMVSCFLFCVATAKEEKKTFSIIEWMILFAIAFMVGLVMMPIIVFPIMFVMVPLLLLFRATSKSKTVRNIALLGLAPMLLVVLYDKWDASSGSPYRKLDKFQLPHHMATRLSKSTETEFTDKQLLDSLFEGPPNRRKNAALLLEGRSSNDDLDALNQTKQEVLKRAGTQVKEDHVTDLIARLDTAIEQAAPPEENSEEEAVQP